MALAIYALGFSLALITVAIPYCSRIKNEAVSSSEQALFFAKLRIIRRYYRELDHLTYSEIIEQYDLDSLYEGIGYRELRRIGR